jgi:hypothetical protein
MSPGNQYKPIGLSRTVEHATRHRHSEFEWHISYFPAQNSGGPGSGSQRGLRGNWNERMNNWR